MDTHVLKVKCGYNPNSSSIGTQVTYFLGSAAVLVLVGNTLTQMVSAAVEKRNQKKREGSTPTGPGKSGGLVKPGDDEQE
jgi:hypothetical protein